MQRSAAKELAVLAADAGEIRPKIVVGALVRHTRVFLNRVGQAKTDRDDRTLQRGANWKLGIVMMLGK